MIKPEHIRTTIGTKPVGSRIRPIYCRWDFFMQQIFDEREADKTRGETVEHAKSALRYGIWRTAYGDLIDALTKLQHSMLKHPGFIHTSQYHDDEVLTQYKQIVSMLRYDVSSKESEAPVSSSLPKPRSFDEWYNEIYPHNDNLHYCITKEAWEACYRELQPFLRNI